jgi:hypothetical protein
MKQIPGMEKRGEGVSGSKTSRLGHNDRNGAAQNARPVLKERKEEQEMEKKISRRRYGADALAVLQEYAPAEPGPVPGPFR